MDSEPKDKKDEPKDDNKTLTPDNNKQIVKGLKKHFGVTKEPADVSKVFLTPDGEWIQLKDGQEHWSVLPAITAKSGLKDKSRQLGFKAYLSQGLIRGGFEQGVVFVNAGVPLNSQQVKSLELIMIKKGLTTDNLVTEFPDDSMEKQLIHKLKKGLGESFCPKCGEAFENNPNHAPAGDSKGGQFTKGDGGSGSDDDKKDEPKTDKTKIDTSKISVSNNKLQREIHDILDKHSISDDDRETLMGAFSRTTDPNSAIGHTAIKNKWEELANKHPEIAQKKKELEQYNKDVNDAVKKQFDETTSLYRGMRTGELDHYIKTGMADPYNYDFVSFTMDKNVGMGFGRNAGVTVEFDKDNIVNQKLWNDLPMIIEPNDYDVYSDSLDGETVGGSYPISYADEVEIRSVQFKVENTIKNITLHQDEYDDADEIKKDLDKYTKAFPNAKVTIRDSKNKESFCSKCGEAVNISGPHSVPDLDKKKKKKFEFIEALDDTWREIEHYLMEDATNSGQKSDTVGNPEFRSFTHSSSFVGNVLWDRESSEMDIILNGKTYHFCRVSERLFDAFEGANSKGEFFNREIKTLHDC